MPVSSHHARNVLPLTASCITVAHAGKDGKPESIPAMSNKPGLKSITANSRKNAISDCLLYFKYERLAKEQELRTRPDTGPLQEACSG
jgi:hypothetical protein